VKSARLERSEEQPEARKDYISKDTPQSSNARLAGS
jgi:hypothetical protein